MCATVSAWFSALWNEEEDSKRSLQGKCLLALKVLP